MGIRPLQSLLTRFRNRTISDNGTHFIQKAAPIPDYARLEDRILFSASPIDVDFLDAPSDALEADIAWDVPDSNVPDGFMPDTLGFNELMDVPLLEVTADSVAQSELPVELLVVDARVDNSEELVRDALTSRSADTQLELLMLDADADGIDQISNALQRLDDVSAIHLVSHGTADAIHLGSTTLKLDNVNGYTREFAAWSDVLSHNADLLIYGCNLADNADGRALVEEIGALTGADVAASIDDTGHALLGGDWELEYAVGSVETQIVFSMDVQQNWSHLMALETVRDDFNGISYDGNDGTQSWTGDWVETDGGGGGGPSGGLITVDAGRLRIQADVANDNILREADLSGATTATLTFGYDNQLTSGDVVRLEISDNGGSSWNFLADYVDGGSPSGSETFDITPYIASDTRIRFIQVVESGDAPMFFDNIQIEYQTGSTVYLKGDGVPVASLSTVAPTASSLPDYDGNDSQPGLIIQKGGSGPTEIDPVLYQTWVAAAGAVTLDGPTSLTLWSSMIDFNSVGGAVNAYLVDCDPGGGSCIQIAQDQITRDPWSGGTWVEDTFDFGSVTYSVPGGRSLGVKIVVDSTSGNDMWFAYDTATYQSRLEYTAVANAAPTIGLPGGAVSYTENDPATIIDATATVTDVDSLNFNGGDLTLSISAGGTTNDVLEIVEGGTVTLVGGNNVKVSGITIGSYSGGTGGTSLVFNWNASATPAAVQDVLRRIAYSNTSEDPATTPRTIDFLLTDGDGGTSNTETESINITPVNDAPTLTATGDNPTFTEGGAAPGLYSSTNINLVEAGNLVDTLTLTVSGLQNGSDEILVVDGTNVALTNGNSLTTGANSYDVNVSEAAGTATVTITKTGGYTAAAAQTLVDTLAYQNNSEDPLGANRTATLTFIKDDGGVANGGDDDTVLSVASTVTLTAVNDDPVITSSSSPIVAENQTAVVTVTSTDVDGGAPTYSLTGGADQGQFAINSSTGELTFNTAPDFENPNDVGTNNVYEVQVTADDGSGGNDVQMINVTITDANDNAPVITPGQSFGVVENSSNGTSVGTMLATDVDTVGSLLNWTITGGNIDGIFAINSATGELTIADNTNLDYETAINYVLSLTVADGVTTSAVETLAINIADFDEFDVGAISDTNAAPNSVSESAAIGATVGITAFADDADVTDNITYSLDADAGGLFAINATTGVVTVNGVLDAEISTSHMITVRATSDDTSFSTQNFTITVTDFDEFDVGAVTDTDVAVNKVNESAPNGSVVGITASASDADVNDNITYSLDDDASGRFTINASSGVISVADSSLLDFEMWKSHNVTVRATSDDLSSSTRIFKIKILDDPTETGVGAISDTDGTADGVNENAAAGTGVGLTAFATDVDILDTVAYSLDDDAGGRFQINGTSGVVTVLNGALLDYESATSHTVVVRATSTDTSFSTRSFTISLIDQNDNAPVVTAVQSFSVDEDAPNATVLGTAQGTDVDTVGALTGWAITAGNTDGIFALNPLTGELAVVDNTLLDFETTFSYTLSVTVGDGVNSSAVETVVVNVNNVNEAAPVVAPPPTSGGGDPPPIEGDSDDSEEDESDALSAPAPATQTQEKHDTNPRRPRALTSHQNDVVTVAPTITIDALNVHIDEATIQAELRSRSTLQDIELNQTSFLGTSDLDFNTVSTALYEGLSKLEDGLMSAVDAQTWSVGYALGMTTGLSVGYVLWIVRSGYLMTSVLSAMAPWMMVDPLLVLDYLDDKEKHARLDQHDSLESMID